jgi:hypothetical protein
MAFAGFKKPKDRADVVAYLKVILINVAMTKSPFIHLFIITFCRTLVKYDEAFFPFIIYSIVIDTVR